MNSTARIVFTPTQEQLQNSDNLILQFERTLAFVTTTSINITDISLTEARRAEQQGEVSSVEITTANAFSYSLPVKSRTVVNQVNAEFYFLERDSAPGETIRIKRQDWVDVGSNRIAATVRLNKVYDEISRIGIGDEGNGVVNFFRVVSTTSNSLRIEFNVIAGREAQFNALGRIDVTIN